nr:hypothetical protein [uncultured Psychrobacter sp.]
MSYLLHTTTSKFFQLTALSLALALTGCGGGGTDTVAPEPDTGVTQPGTGGDGNNGDGNGEPTVPVQSLNINNSQLVDINGNLISTVSLNGAYYEVQVTDANGQPVPNARVSFDIDADGVELSQTTSGSTLTDTDGRARIFLKPNAPDVSGAYTITANVSNASNTAIDNFTFSVQTTAVRISQLSFDQTSLESGGETKVRFNVSDTAGNALSGVMVNLVADCGQLPDQVTSDSNGAVEFTYRGINQDNTLCSGMVRLSASTGNSTQSSNIMIQASQANSIVYTSNELTLGIQNSGSSRTGRVEFTVYSNNIPVPNADVVLSLEKAPLGLSFGTLDNRADFRARTDSAGKVSVEIYPGSTPGPVEIEATLASDPRINALSRNISIAGSRVTQDGLSISLGTNILDWSFDGNETPIVARMVDRNGNAVPDGTVINFTTEGGKISPASCATNDGVCEVTFSTQNPRPGDGRVSILAVAEGEKAYIDKNQNNAWDRGIDTLVHNIGDTFRDDNESGFFEIGEFTYPLVTRAEQPCEDNVRQFIQLKFPTVSEIQKQSFEQNYVSKYVSPNKRGTCNLGLDTVVRYQAIQLLTLGKQEAEFSLVNANGSLVIPQVIRSTDATVRVRINSSGFLGLNPMPSGTNVSGTILPRNAPVVTITKGDGIDFYVIRITNLKPIQDYTFTIGDNEYFDTSNSDGVLTRSLELVSKPEASDIEIEQSQGECKVTLESPAQVPDIVSTGELNQNLGTISKFSLENCEAGDKFKVSTTSPSNNTYSEIYTIR